VRSILDSDKKASTGLRTLDRGLSLLDVLAQRPDGAAVKELSQSLNVNLSTCYHLVKTLLDRGYVSKAADRKIRLGPALGNLYGAYSRQLRPERDLLPILAHLSEATGETVCASSWDGGDVVLRAVVEGPQILRVSGLQPGLRSAAHSRSAGKAMLAYLGEPGLTHFLETHQLTPKTSRTITNPELLRKELVAIASLGFAEDPGEFSEDLWAIAAPYFDAGGGVLGALSVPMPLSRKDAMRPKVIKAVLAAAEEASRALGYSGLYPPPVEGQE
jgi:IclR family transcriptional regulator, acetate operon repressor